MILIISNRFDPTVDMVVKYLATKSIDVYRLNLDQYFANVDLCLRYDTAKVEMSLNESKRITTDTEIQSVWYLDPLRTLPDGFEEYSKVEQESVLTGLYHTLENAYWINDLPKHIQASNKIQQLKIAIQCGLRTPKTIITNVPEVAEEFIHNNMPVVMKVLNKPRFHYETGGKMVFTSLIQHKDIPFLKLIKNQPILIQKYIPKQLDLRVIWVEGKFFASEMHTQVSKESMIDWRRGSLAKMPQKIHDLPEPIKLKCNKFMNELGLRFGAFDFVVDGSGDYYFLEVNPAGAWGWMEEKLDLPISKAIGDCLINHGDENANIRT